MEVLFLYNNLGQDRACGRKASRRRVSQEELASSLPGIIFADEDHLLAKKLNQSVRWAGRFKAPNKIQGVAGAASGGMDGLSHICGRLSPRSELGRELGRRLQLEPRQLREQLERRRCARLPLPLV